MSGGKTMLILLGIIVISGIVIYFTVYSQISDLRSEIDTWKMYCRDATIILNNYKPQKKEYIGKKYNNTNNGEIITITDMFYEKDCGYLWLTGKTPSGQKVEAPYTHFSWHDKKQATYLGTCFDLQDKKRWTHTRIP